MGWLSDARTAVKDLLTAETDGVNVWDYNPERVIAPAIAVTYGTPLATEGLTFADLLVRFEVTVIPRIGTNQSSTDALDALIETSVVALLEADYGIEQVGQPYMLQANNAQYLAVDITVTVQVQPEGN